MGGLYHVTHSKSPRRGEGLRTETGRSEDLPEFLLDYCTDTVGYSHISHVTVSLAPKHLKSSNPTAFESNVGCDENVGHYSVCSNS